MKALVFVYIIFLVSMAIAFMPAGNAIRLDGVISEGEWNGAAEHELAGGGKLMLKKEGHVLLAAIAANKKGWAHVYLSSGDTVRVLHASAALGEARYVKQNDLWRIIQSFQWQLRDREYTDVLAKKQEDHYKQYGWVANNNNLGNGMVFEFKLDFSRVDAKPTFACVMAGIPLDLHFFPTSIKDNTILPRLVQGYTPDSLQFVPGSWEKIK